MFVVIEWMLYLFIYFFAEFVIMDYGIAFSMIYVMLSWNETKQGILHISEEWT